MRFTTTPTEKEIPADKRKYRIVVTIPACRQGYVLSEDDVFGDPEAYAGADQYELLKGFLDLGGKDDQPHWILGTLGEFGMLPDNFAVDVTIEEVKDDI